VTAALVLPLVAACGAGGSTQVSSKPGAGAPNLYLSLTNDTSVNVNAAACRQQMGHQRARCDTGRHGTLAPGGSRAFDLSPSAVPGSLPSTLRVSARHVGRRCLTFSPSSQPRRLHVKVSALKPGSC
jgi:hypothetical protein